MIIEGTEKAERYYYELLIIQLLLSIKLKTSASFRATIKITEILRVYLNLTKQSPSYQTVLTWVKKIGYYNLVKPKQKSDDWIIIIDESIQLGQEKLLVIFGVRESELLFKTALNFSELTPLKEIVKTSWNGELIKEELIKLKAELGTIIYAVGDYGSNIKKGLRLSEIKHVHDITHRIALTLEKIYKADVEYIEFTKLMSMMRRQYSQTKMAHIIPPKQRTKSRYQNIKTISDWGVKVLNLLNDTSKNEENEIVKKLKWVKKYQLFLEELSEINQSICQIEKITKTNGLTEITINRAKEIMGKLSIENSKAKRIKSDLEDYFHLTTTLLSGSTTILCTSDIIESAFGKYKNYLSNNPMAGITDLALCISAFTSSLTQAEIKTALEYTTMNDLKKWTEKNIGMTLLKKRRETFSVSEMG